MGVRWLCDGWWQAAAGTPWFIGDQDPLAYDANLFETSRSGMASACGGCGGCVRAETSCSNAHAATPRHGRHLTSSPHSAPTSAMSLLAVANAGRLRRLWWLRRLRRLWRLEELRQPHGVATVGSRRGTGVRGTWHCAPLEHAGSGKQGESALADEVCAHAGDDRGGC
jgi:hypothetical protein